MDRQQPILSSTDIGETCAGGFRALRGALLGLCGVVGLLVALLAGVPVVQAQSLPTVSIAGPTGIPAYEGADLTFTVSLSATLTENVLVTYSTADGATPAQAIDGTGARDGVDYTGQINETVTILADEPSATITVKTIDDTYDDRRTFESMRVVLSAVSSNNATLGTASAIGRIRDNENSPRVSVVNDFSEDGLSNTATFSTPEGNSATKTLAIPLYLEFATENTVQLDYSTSNLSPVSAAAGEDYVSASVTDAMPFALIDGLSGTTGEILITINGDTTSEDDEEFLVTFASPSRASFPEIEGVRSLTATGRIINDDNALASSTPTVALKDGAVYDTGSSSTDDITSNTTPTFTVTDVVAASEVVVKATKQGTTTTVSKTVTSSGTSVDVEFTGSTCDTGDDATTNDDPCTLADGDWDIVATHTQVARAAATSATLNLVIDITAPVIAITGPAGPAESKTVSAADDEPDAARTSWQHFIILAARDTDTCAGTPPDNAPAYTEGDILEFTNMYDNGKYVCFYATDVAGNISATVSDEISITAQQASSTPTVALKAGAVFDTGSSTTDNITGNNTPTFTVTGVAASGMVVVRATRKGTTTTVSRTATSSGASVDVAFTGNTCDTGDDATTNDDPCALEPDGIWRVVATHSQASRVAATSATLVLEIDTTAPVITVANPAAGAARTKVFSASAADSTATTWQFVKQT
ncbi:MAG: hypothetical protein ACR2PR_05805, partial [Pseudohongiellaceae bacterium]